jgi:hypothetical protein
MRTLRGPEGGYHHGLGVSVWGFEVQGKGSGEGGYCFLIVGMVGPGIRLAKY